MDERRRRLLGPLADDADARGEHQYPDESAPTRVEAAPDLSRRSGEAAKADEALTRDPSEYVAGAEGTQRITTPASAEPSAGRPASNG